LSQPKRRRLPQQRKPTQRRAIRTNLPLDMTNDIKLGRLRPAKCDKKDVNPQV